MSLILPTIRFPILLCYHVTEEYEDKDIVPEDFGFVTLDHNPLVGEVIQLKWIDGRDAYKLIVTSVIEYMLELRGKRYDSDDYPIPTCWGTF